MKKIIFGVMLPLLAFVSLLGSGFATWYFDTEEQASASVGVTVSDYATVGTFGEISDGITLNLDQVGSASDQTGIVLSQDINLLYTAASGENITAPANTAITATITLPDGLGAYVEITLAGFVKQADSDVYVYTGTELNKTLNSACFSYVASSVDTVDKYLAMNALAVGNIVISLEATISAATE